jgi:superfamily II DNA or RNA helicase
MHLVGVDERGREFAEGVYPLLEGDGCRFAGVEFGGVEWMRDAAAVRAAAERLGCPVLVERVGEGEGARLWWFFEGVVAAGVARRLVFRILSEAFGRCPEMGFGVYDRVFPERDTVPRDGFGRVVALPLQGGARREGKAVFVDEDFQIVRDPWAALSAARPLDGEWVAERVRDAEREGRVFGVASAEDALGGWRGAAAVPAGEGGKEGVVCVTLGEEVVFRKGDLTPGLQAGLLRLAAFENPEFVRAERMRLGTRGMARVVACGRMTEDVIVLPRGCREAAFGLVEAAGLSVAVEDWREAGERQGFVFRGTLRGGQERAVRELLRHEDGILAAGTAFGKTVAALRIVAERNTGTLVLVNRRQLIDQWVQRIAQFLGVPEREVGRIGGGRRRATGRIDVATIQSLGRGREGNGGLGMYGFVVVDECHSLSAPTFERVVRGIGAKYVLGLSATPVRRDGLHPVVAMLCGPVRYVADAEEVARAEPFAHVAIVRPTGFRLSLALAEAVGRGERTVFSAISAELAGNAERNAQIAADVVRAAREGRVPLVLTDRREHVAVLAELVGLEIGNVFAMQGGLGRKAMRNMLAALEGLPAGAPRAVVATGQFLGEGFDYPPLDTLFLAMPISWRGRIAQYAGRLHRLHAGKREVRILDYADLEVPLLARMFGRRREAYAAIGYEVRIPATAQPGWPSGVGQPTDPGWEEAFGGSVARLCRDGADGALADLFVRAAATEIPKDASGVARARSNAEAFLYRRLETLPETRGRFELNGLLPIPFAESGDMEVDLLDRKSRLAIEIDGIHHFAGEDAWRRDRRKDFLLQRFGYLVLRFLAADVTRRLGEILDTISIAVRSRE